MRLHNVFWSIFLLPHHHHVSPPSTLTNSQYNETNNVLNQDFEIKEQIFQIFVKFQLA